MRREKMIMNFPPVEFEVISVQKVAQYRIYLYF